MGSSQKVFLVCVPHFFHFSCRELDEYKEKVKQEICDLFIMERRKILCLNVRHGNKKHNKRKEQKKPAAQYQRQFQTS